MPPQPTSPNQSISSEESAPSTYALAGPGEGPPYALIKRSNSAPSANDAVPRMFNDFPEREAICAFFLDFVLLPRHPDSVRGHLEHLLPLYKKASPDSLCRWRHHRLRWPYLVAPRHDRMTNNLLERSSVEPYGRRAPRFETPLTPSKMRH